MKKCILVVIALVYSLLFANMLFAGTYIKSDFNADGISDILWTNAYTGQHTLWFMNADGTSSGYKDLLTNKDWTIAGTGDFNGNGISDIIWRKDSTGYAVLWFMKSDGTRASYKDLLTNTDWTIAGTGDFNNDGISDIIWRRDSTGYAVLWFMKSDGTRASYKDLLTNTNWRIAGTGDFNKDGISDILWRNTSTGQALLWFMKSDGTRASYKDLLTNTDWTIAGTGDFNKDGISDILWRKFSTGYAVLWFMKSDGTRSSCKDLLTNSDWTIAGTGDFNKDGISDIIWRKDSTGYAILWFMKSDGTHSSYKDLLTDPDWRLVQDYVNITLVIPPAGASLSYLVDTGLDFLKNSSAYNLNIYNAHTYFKAAVTNYPGDASNYGDTARFFYALTRVAGINLSSDGNSTDLNSVGDILDRAGCSAKGRSLMNPTMVCPETLPSNFPSGRGMQIFLYNAVIRPELEGALANLNGVRTSFVKTWTNPIDSKSYISDYGDVLVFKAAIKAALAVIHIQYTYNLNADIDAEVYNKSNTFQNFLISNSDFLKLMSGSYSSSRSTARTYLSEVGDNLIAAIDKVKTRNTAAYFVNLAGDTSTEINNAKASINRWKLSLTSNQRIDGGDDEILGGAYGADDVIINLSPFFAGLNLRSLLPPFTDDTPGQFPDNTMGGIIIQGKGYVNRDLDGNGIPDILD